MASIVNQPHATPETVDAYHISKKYAAEIHALADVPHNNRYIPAPFLTTLIHHAAPYHVALMSMLPLPLITHLILTRREGDP